MTLSTHSTRTANASLALLALAACAALTRAARADTQDAQLERANAPRAATPRAQPLPAGATAATRLSTTDTLFVPAGDFVMGSNEDDLERARAVCERDNLVGPVLAWACVRVFPPVEAARVVGSPCERPAFSRVMFAERGRHRAVLGAFAIDRTEVTVRAYERCAEDGGCPRNTYVRSAPALAGDSQPIVAVTWHEASAYCRWARGRLPTEAEWERVARGRDGRMFPWGNVFNPQLANVGQASVTCRSSADGYEFTAPVGSFPDGASADGALDMAGNVAEWVDDSFDDGPERAQAEPDWSLSRSRYEPDVTRVAPRVRVATSNLRGYRGGSFVQGAAFARTTYRQRLSATERRDWLGFRCAYDAR